MFSDFYWRSAEVTLLQERPKFASVMGEEAASFSGDGGGAGGAKAAEAGGGGNGLAAAENAGELPAHSLLVSSCVYFWIIRWIVCTMYGGN